jgi:hypothetical protein
MNSSFVVCPACLNVRVPVVDGMLAEHLAVPKGLHFEATSDICTLSGRPASAPKLSPSDNDTYVLVATESRPQSVLAIAVSAATQAGIQYPVLPLAESDTKSWGRIVGITGLEKSLRRLTDRGVLVAHTGREWIALYGREHVGYLEPRTRYWASRTAADLWAARNLLATATEKLRKTATNPPSSPTLANGRNQGSTCGFSTHQR